jgi:hypothetical protein
MIGSVEECRFFSVGEIGEVIYDHFRDTVRYTSFRDDTWELYANGQWDPVSKEQLRQMFVEYITATLNEFTQTLNMKYFSHIGDYERTCICDKITKIQRLQKIIRTDADKYGDLLLEETRSYFHFLVKEEAL